MMTNNALKRIIIGVLGLIGAGIVLLLTYRHGSGITPDSVSYISAARNLSEGKGFLTYNGEYLVFQPPLYSMILALIKITLSTDPIISAGYVNAILFGLIVFISGLLFLNHLKSFILVVLGTGSLLISFAIVQSSLMTLSEPLFIFILLMFLFYIEVYQNEHNIYSLVLISVFGALACLTRYTGIIIILTGLISIFIWSRIALKEKIKHSFFFLLITCLPISIWCIRNYFISGTLVGQRAQSSYTLVDNLKFYYNTILSWFLPVNLVSPYLIIILLIFFWMFLELDLSNTSGKDGIKLIGPSFIFIVLYSAVIVISSTTTAYDYISNRLLCPIYIPIIYILFLLADKIHQWLAKYLPKLFVTALLGIGIILMMKYPYINTKYFINEFIDQSGYEYSCSQWRNSETIRFVAEQKQLCKEYNLYSNAPEAIYILANIYSRFSPTKTFYNSPQLYKNQKQIDMWKNDDKVCLIWFDKIRRNFLFSIDELQKDKKITEEVQLNDGKIFLISK